MTSNSTDFSILRNQAASALVRNVLLEVEGKYGSNQAPGRSWLTYHNRSHSAQVEEVAAHLAQTYVMKGVLHPNEISIIRIAAAHHDVEQDLRPGENEQLSADKAIEAMRLYPNLFDATDEAKVRDMIMGTEVYFTQLPATMHQVASPNNLWQAIIADADLSSLGMSNGPLVGLLLLAEIESKAGRLSLPSSARDLAQIQIDPTTLYKFVDSQIRLLETHTYLTEVGKDLFGAGQTENLQWWRNAKFAVENGANFPELLQSATLVAEQGTSLTYDLGGSQ